MENINTDILIIGAGSGGFGAVVSALKESGGKYSITVVDKNPGFGGSSTFGGVNNWEPGVAGMGIHYKLVESLMKTPFASGVGKGTGGVTPETPWGTSVVVDEPYESTLRRSGTPIEEWRRFHFEPRKMSEAMLTAAISRGKVNFLFNTVFTAAEVKGGRIQCVYVESKEKGITYRITASVYIDCTADIAVARNAGCSASIGEEAASEYDEPSAPEKASSIVNGVTLLFRVSLESGRTADKNPEPYNSMDVSDWVTDKLNGNINLVSCFNYYPNGDININMLPTMEGSEYMKLGSVAAMEVCKARVYRYWNWLRREKGLANYRFAGFFPQMGVRETYRLKGQYVLREQDVRAGLLRQEKKSEFIAFGDHALDTHGKTGVKGVHCGELMQPYGIPYSCLLPREVENLMVACRGASFSHIAASSCRLSRMMVAIGEAAGTVAVMALNTKKEIFSVNNADLQKKLYIREFAEKIVEKWGIG